MLSHRGGHSLDFSIFYVYLLFNSAGPDMLSREYCLLSSCDHLECAARAIASGSATERVSKASHQMRGFFSHGSGVAHEKFPTQDNQPRWASPWLRPWLQIMSCQILYQGVTACGSINVLQRTCLSFRVVLYCTNTKIGQSG